MIRATLGSCFYVQHLVNSLPSLHLLIILPIIPAPRKANQDTFDVMLNLAGESGDTFFAVYDGHGEAGHHCANYAKKKLPQALAKFVRQKRVQRYAEQRRAEGSTSKQHWNQKMWPLLGVVDFESCCKSSVLETNKSMHEDLTVRFPCKALIQSVGECCVDIHTPSADNRNRPVIILLFRAMLNLM